MSLPREDEASEATPLLLLAREASTTRDTTDAREEELHNAIRTRDLSAVTRLLDEGVSLLCRDQHLHTPLHLCIVYYWYPFPPYNENQYRNVHIEMEIIRKILEKADRSENKNDILESFEGSGSTPLDWAICYGSTEVIQLLVEHGASYKKVSITGQSALHAAVSRPVILEFFLNHCGDINNFEDGHGSTAMHVAGLRDKEESLKILVNRFGHADLAHRDINGSTVFHVAALNASVKFFEQAIHLADSDATEFLKMVNNNNETAFFIAIKECNMDIVALLLRMGSVLSEKDNQGRTAIDLITKHFDNPLIFLENVLDESVTLRFDKICACNKSDTYVSYNKLTNSDGMSQIKVIEYFVRCGLTELLIHPVIESLLYLKWICLLPVIYVLIAIYAIFLVSLNTFLVTTLHSRDAYKSACNSSGNMLCNGTDSPSYDCFNGWSWMWITFIYLSIFLMLVQEYGYIYVQKRHYFVPFESWVKLCLFALAAVVTASVGCDEPAVWLRHAASVTLLLSWVQAMLLLSRFPVWGYYVLMIERVAYNIFKILLTSVCLVIGFSLAFMIEFHSLPPFEDPGAAFVKTFVMMASEFDYGDIFEGDLATKLPDTKPVVRLLFVIFVIFVAIVLMNFMIGVAVSDINELNIVGNIRRLEKQVELQCSLIDSPLVKLIGAISDLTYSPLIKLLNRCRCCQNYSRESFELEVLDVFEQHNRPELKDGSKISRLLRREYHYKIYKNTKSDGKWHILGKVSNSEDTFLIRQSLATELQNAIINVRRKNVQKEINEHEKTEKKNKTDAFFNALSSVKEKNESLEISIQDMNNKLFQIMKIIKTIKRRTNSSHRKTRKENKYRS